MPGNLNLQFISFTVGGEEYCADIIAIREIKGWSTTTELPNTPQYIRGVMNLRGSIVPIIDLRARFGGRRTDPSDRHVVIVMAVDTRVVGILVDAVADIITATADDIQPIPQLQADDRSGFLTGLVTVEGRMVALLDLDRVLDLEDAAA